MVPPVMVGRYVVPPVTVGRYKVPLVKVGTIHGTTIYSMDGTWYRQLRYRRYTVPPTKVGTVRGTAGTSEAPSITRY